MMSSQSLRLLVLCILTVSATKSLAAVKCDLLTYQKLSAWRSSMTIELKGKLFVPTTQAREREIKTIVDDMIDVVLNQDATPVMEFVPAAGTKMKTLRDANYERGIVPKVKISGLGKSGKLKGTIMLPVSGHTGAANARAWAKTDTLSVIHIAADGKRTELSNNIRSRDVVTIQELEFSLEKAKIVQLEYWRSGSAGPGGFRPGRVLEIEWDGT